MGPKPNTNPLEEEDDDVDREEESASFETGAEDFEVFGFELGSKAEF